jgi:hypothetical protein
MTAQQIGEIVWNLLMFAAGATLAITGGKYLHLIDKAFPEKRRTNPEAAAKQVRTFRFLGAGFAIIGLLLVIEQLLKARK